MAESMGTFELVAPEQVIEGEIADGMTQKEIAKTYALAMRVRSSPVDWARINNAIIDRWSRSGLERVKKLAHSGKCFQ